jgi:hypothetical protein
MKTGDIVIAPEGCEDYLTAGKGYIVAKIESFDETFGWFFTTQSDTGITIYTSEKSSPHLGYQDWILKPTSHDNSKDDKTITK